MMVLGHRNSCWAGFSRVSIQPPPAVTLLYMHECSAQPALGCQGAQETPPSTLWLFLLQIHQHFHVYRAKRTLLEKTTRCWLAAE